MKRSYEELVQLYQAGEIGWKEIALETDENGEYRQWLEARGEEPTEENARLFIEEDEARINELETV